MKTFSHGMVVVIVISEVDGVVMVVCFSFFVILLSRISFDWGLDVIESIRQQCTSSPSKKIKMTMAEVVVVSMVMEVGSSSSSSSNN